MICFHFTTFAVLETASNQFPICFPVLWFAFILLPLPYWKQRCGFIFSANWSCDLLSFYYLCRTGNSPEYYNAISYLLWFAFILLPLPYWKQHRIKQRGILRCCDLLSFYYLCRTGNSRCNWRAGPYRVVICFHFTTFAVLETALLHCSFPLLGLWFAFILLPLPYWKQLAWQNNSGSFGCDLLSFYYLCRTGNSTAKIGLILLPVVICFHFTTFAVLETAHHPQTIREMWLWFAFILLPLPYWKQPKRNSGPWHDGCDLLSFYYLCRTGNSYCYYYNI